MATKKKPAKDRIKAKAEATKAKVKAKVKAGCAVVAAILSLVLFEGCSTATPASRATTATVGDVSIANRIEEIKGSPRGCACAKPCACGESCTCGKEGKAPTPMISIVSKITFGDMALASADSAGSTETQTATPTTDIKPDLDLRYNDAIAGATTASKGVLETLLASSANKVLALMQSKETGTVEVQKTDGSTATVKCENGQCSFCEDCVAK